MGLKCYQYSPAENISQISKLTEPRMANISGIELYIDPQVFPSDYFRTTQFLMDEIKDLTANQRVCDMGCGAGIIGITAAYQKAKKVVMVDINSFAVENAHKNACHHQLDDVVTTHLSDCFDDIDLQVFDVIVFNIPFHCDDVVIKSPLELAFFDPCFKSVHKFLRQATSYLSPQGTIVIPFSNAGDVEGLEKIFDLYQYDYKLIKKFNSSSKCDNRIYHLKNPCFETLN